MTSIDQLESKAIRDYLNGVDVQMDAFLTIHTVAQLVIAPYSAKECNVNANYDICDDSPAFFNKMVITIFYQKWQIHQKPMLERLTKALSYNGRHYTYGTSSEALGNVLRKCLTNFTKK